MYKRLLLCVVLCSAAKAEDVEMRCNPAGRFFKCHAVGVADRKLAPLWTLHSDPMVQSWGDEFSWTAPRRWTRITMIALNDDDTGGVRACGEVRLIDHKAKFRYCTKETEPKTEGHPQ
jgi:hypothetical protein